MLPSTRVMITFEYYCLLSTSRGSPTNITIRTLFTAFSIGHFFRISVKQVLISCTSMFLSDIDRRYYMMQAQMFLQPRLVTLLLYSLWSAVYSALALTLQGRGKQGVTHWQ